MGEQNVSAVETAIRPRLIRVAVQIAAPRERVWHALSDGAELSVWFAEHVRVNFAEREFTFCGRFTPDTPCTHMPQANLAYHEELRKLAVQWQIRGISTLCEFRLEDNVGGTRLTLVHSGLPQRSEGQFSFVDFWQIALSNLRGHVEQGRSPLRFDYYEAPAGTVTIPIDIEAPAERIWGILTQQELLDKVMGGQSSIELGQGGAYSYGWDSGGPLRILELRSHELLRHDWRYENEPDTEVSWRLESSGGATRLTLVHSGFGPGRNNNDYSTGWMNFLIRIRELAEEGTVDRVSMLDYPGDQSC